MARGFLAGSDDVHLPDRWSWSGYRVINEKSSLFDPDFTSAVSSLLRLYTAGSDGGGAIVFSWVPVFSVGRVIRT